MSAKIIVIVRTEGGGDDLADVIAGKGYLPLHEPVLSVDYADTPLPETLDDETPLVFTSANGVRAFARKSGFRGNPVYTVGSNTADEAELAGFETVENAGGTVEDLADILIKSLGSSLKRPIYVRGTEISQDLAQMMSKGGVQVDEWMGYRTIPAQNLSINLLKSLDNREVEAILFFSSRGGQVFSDLIEQYDRVTRMRTIKALCISDAVVKSVSVLPFQQSVAAENPDRYGMIKLLDKIPDVLKT